MSTSIFRRGLNLIMQQQTNILSAAFVIMATIVFSQVLGVVRTRLLIAIFGASNRYGIYQVAHQVPESLFQIVIAGALYSAFIPIFTDFYQKKGEEEAHRFASNFLVRGLMVSIVISIILFIFARQSLDLFNIGGNYTESQMTLMSNLLRVIVFGQILFFIGSILSAILQSYNRFFIPGFAAALYNLGIILGVLLFSSRFGIYAPAFGVILGALLYVLFQIPAMKTVNLRLRLKFEWNAPGMSRVTRLMLPRTISIAVAQVSILLIIALISYIPNPGRNKVVFDLAQTLAFAPVVLFGQALGQAAFPVLSKEREDFYRFKQIFITSFMQLLYLVLPVSVLFLVLRIPIVRLIYGSHNLDWQATVTTGKTLAFFSLAIFAQALFYLISRAFYALHDTKVPLIVSMLATIITVTSGFICIRVFHLGITSLAFSVSLGGIFQFLVLFLVLDRKVQGFEKMHLIISASKIFLAAFFTGVALYIPLKLLDQLVFDTTHTIGLLLLTGISSVIGLSLYLFLTWFFDVKEATTFLLLFRHLGNWRQILGQSKEPVEVTRL